MAQEQINATLIEHALAGRRVVRLKGGDPYVFGRGGEEAVTLARAGVRFTAVPGVSSATGGLAAAGIPVTHRGLASSFAVVTGHEDPAKPEAPVQWERLATAVDTLVVLMGVGRLEAIASALISGGRDARTPSALVQAATTPDQRVVEAPLGDIVEATRAAGIEAPALFVVGEVVRLRERLAGAGSPLARRRVLVTRTRSQASTLADALRAEGAVPVMLPAIEIERRADPEAVRASAERLRAGHYAWTVFSSENAVSVYLDLLAEAGADARVFARCRLCAIGAATARALAARGLIADLVAEEADSEGVVAALGPRRIAGQAVLLPPRRGRPRGAARGAARGRRNGGRAHALPLGAPRRAAAGGAGAGSRREDRHRDLHLLVHGAQPGDAARRRPVVAAPRRGRLHRPLHGRDRDGGWAAATGGGGRAHGAGTGRGAARIPTLSPRRLAGGPRGRANLPPGGTIGDTAMTAAADIATAPPRRLRPHPPHPPQRGAARPGA